MIEIRNLCKSFSGHPVLKDLSLKIPDGSVFGLVGPNGAGKTTTFRIMAGLLKADSGKILVDGEDIHIGRNRDIVGYMPDFFGVYDKLRVNEYMEFFASIYNIEGSAARERIQELLSLAGLSQYGDVYVDTLSRGMKQKLCLARCLIHDPRILILDEPASGMDPRARIEFREIIRKLNESGTTILISSHILTELSHMCSEICILHEGSALISGSISEIEYRLTQKVRLVIRLASGMEKALAVLKEDPLADNLSYTEGEIYVSYSGSHEEEAALLSRLMSSGAGVFSFANDRGGLEELFMQITGSGGGSGERGNVR